MKKRIVFITEYLNPPYDEGIKKTVYNLFLELDKKYELLVICRHGFNKENIKIVKTNPLFLSYEVKELIRSFKPESLIYLPFQSSTFASYLRLRLLVKYSKNTPNILIALQPKPLKKWQQYLVNYLKPEIAFTPSPELKSFWDGKSIKNILMPLLTDLSVFKPLENKALKKELRKKYELPIDAVIISHMGHLNEGRNLRSLIPLQHENVQVVVVSSSSTPNDALGSNSLPADLENAGIIILNRYIDHIEEIYQLSDLYIFPVIKLNSSIGMPLSILEARSCGIPVISTDYGSIRHFLENDQGGIIYSEPDKFLGTFKEFRSKLGSNFNETMVLELNNTFYNTVNNKINL